MCATPSRESRSQSLRSTSLLSIRPPHRPKPIPTPLPPLGNTSSSSNAIIARAMGRCGTKVRSLAGAGRLLAAFTAGFTLALTAGAAGRAVLAAAGFFAGLAGVVRAGVAPAFFLVVEGAIGVCAAGMAAAPRYRSVGDRNCAPQVRPGAPDRQV